MKRILILAAATLASASVLASELLPKLGSEEAVIIVVGESRPADVILPKLEVAEYIAEDTGEVIPEFVPGEVEKTARPVRTEIFHPPKIGKALVSKVDLKTLWRNQRCR